MRKLVNSADDVVADALEGMAAAHPDELRVDVGDGIVYRSRVKDHGKVTIVSGVLHCRARTTPAVS